MGKRAGGGGSEDCGGGGAVSEKGGTAEIGRTGCDGEGLFHHKSLTVCQGHCRTIRSHPLISKLLPIKSQPHSARLALEGQIRLPNHTFSKSTFPQLRCVLRYQTDDTAQLQMSTLFHFSYTALVLNCCLIPTRGCSKKT